MAQLETTFNNAPYWDDYELTKKEYYRILFTPKRAVQVRELNQVQAIIQEQIRRFGNHVFKDGSIVDGCNITHHTLNYARFENGYENANSNNAFDENIYGFMLVSPTTGARAVISLVKRGWVLQYPDTNVMYFTFIKSGRDVSGNEVQDFLPGETLDIYTKEQGKFDELEPQYFYNSYKIITPIPGADQLATGVCTAVTVGQGIVYQKGYFVGVNTHTIAVKPYDTDTTDMVVGFQTLESIITHLQDETLIDPVDTSNRNAIGADRLRLTPVLVARNKTTLTDKDDFFPIISYGKERPVVQNIDPEYAKLGDVMAKRTYEESGDYYIKPFIVSTQNSANTARLRYALNPGTAYVKGNRVELVATDYLEVDRATETAETNAAIITLNYGNYILAKELVGTFGADKLIPVTIYNTPQLALTNGSGATSPATGTNVGTANIRAVIYNSGTKGTPSAEYRVYLTDIKMNSNRSFTQDAKSIFASTPYGNAKADIVLENNRASIKDVGRSSLVFDLGFEGVKRLRDASGANDTQFTFRSTSSATLQSNGSVTFTLNMPHAGGSERFFSSPGVLSNVNELRVDISSTANIELAAFPGTVSGSTSNATITGVGTQFTTNYRVGDTIRIASTPPANKRIVAIANNTSLTVDSNLSTAASDVAHSKYIVAGSILDLGSADVTVNSNTQFTVNLASAVAAGAPQTLHATYPVFRSQAVEMKKEVLRNRFVKIDCGTNTAGTTGPYNLGLVDVFKIQNVYIGDSYSESNPDRASWFTLSTGQTDSSYEHATLALKPQFKGKLSATTKILVKLSHFKSSNVTGVGFYSVDSYPVRLPGAAVTANTISYAEIPNFNGKDLRNCIDYRPQRFDTAQTATNAANATINPVPANSSFNIAGSGVYLAEPDSNFQADGEYYMPRIDLIQVNKDGVFNVKQSVSSINPTVPIPDMDSMPVAVVHVPPYPTLTGDEKSLYGRNVIAQPTLMGTRGYTMPDINALDNRISVLEYYITLSMLEAQAKDMTVRDENGLDRFKNGIFADPFNNHSLGDVTNFEYTIGIDERIGVARPRFTKHNIDLRAANLTNTVQSNQTIKLPHTSVVFAEQQYASKFRNVTESVWNWSGQMNLFPDYDHFRDEKTQPDVNITIDIASPWEDFANSPFGMQFGEWDVSSTSRVSGQNTQTQSTGNRLAGTSITTEFTTTETTTVSTRTNNQLNVDSSIGTQNLGSYISDFTMNPFMRSREVAIIATSLKPNSKFYAFFDKIPVSQHVAPAKLNSTFDPNNGTIEIVSGKESEVVSRIGNWGTQLTSDSAGNLYGIFKIPAETFRVGDRELLICNVDNLEIGADAITSATRATYTASSLTVTSNSINVHTKEPKLSTSTTHDRVVDTTSTTTSRVVGVSSWNNTVSERETGGGGGRGEGDPLGQSFVVEVPNGVPGIFVDSIDVFFRSKDSKLGVTCYLCEMSAGVPDTRKIIATSYLKPSGVSVSDNASAATKFLFKDIPYLTGDRYYAFFIKPDGDSPEYTLWMAEIGGTDVITGVKIFSNPYIGVAFKSANSNSWDVLSTEDVKFRVNRCNFTQLSGTATFWEQDDDYLTVAGFNYTSPTGRIEVGDLVYSANASGVVNTAANAPFGYVQEVDVLNDRLVIDGSRGGFTANMNIQIHRPADTSNASAISASTMIASTKIVSVDDIEYSIVIPRISSTTPSGTRVSFRYKGAGDTMVMDTNWSEVQGETEVELIDKMRVIKSKSNRGSNTHTAEIEARMVSTSPYITPTIDLRRKALYVVENLINNDVTGEETRYGNALSKYLSKKVILAEGQDAEDIKIFVTGYRPYGTDIHCYIKIQNGDDADKFENKLWTKMDLVEGKSTTSSAVDVEDFREFGFAFPKTEQLPGTAYSNASNRNIVEYKDSNGSIFIGYKSFAIKLVLTSTRKERVPRMKDVRSLALQI